MVTTPSGIQADLSKVVHPSHRPICHLSEYKVLLNVSPVRDKQALKIDALNIDWSGLIAYAYPPMTLLHRVIRKIHQCNCFIILIARGWPGMPWFWNLVHISKEILFYLVKVVLLKSSVDRIWWTPHLLQKKSQTVTCTFCRP